MFLTKKDLEDRNACEFGIKLIDRLYPNGAELLEILENRHIPVSIFHWGYINLPSNEEEKKKYLEVVKVKNSTGVFFSDNIEDSSSISESHLVKKSNIVFNSKNVINSKNIFSSEKILNSHFIYSSKNIEDSKMIKNSKNIFYSDNIVNSDTIKNGSNIVYSSRISMGSHLYHCEELKNCFFSSNCKNLYNAILCENLNGNLDPEKFYLFNKEIMPAAFINVRDKLKDFLYINFDLFKNSKENLLIESDLDVNYNFGTYYKNFPNSFYDLLKTLPNYSEEIAYNITLNYELLFN